MEWLWFQRMRFSLLERIKIVAVVTLSFLKACVSDDGTEDNGTEGVVVERAFTVRPGMEEQSKIWSERQSECKPTFIRQAVCKDLPVQKNKGRRWKTMMCFLCAACYYSTASKNT